MFDPFCEKNYVVVLPRDFIGNSCQRINSEQVEFCEIFRQSYRHRITGIMPISGHWISKEPAHKRGTAG
jgi:hypothetical protein